MMHPPPWGIIFRADAKAHKKGPLALTSITLSHPSSVSFSAAAPPPIAALETITSIRPKRRQVSSMRASTSLRRETSVRRNAIGSPRGGFGSRMSAATTLAPAPCRPLAMAVPRPPAAPVTTATLPEISKSRNVPLIMGRLQSHHFNRIQTLRSLKSSQVLINERSPLSARVITGAKV